jgi:hypothetical protein
VELFFVHGGVRACGWVSALREPPFKPYWTRGANAASRKERTNAPREFGNSCGTPAGKRFNTTVDECLFVKAFGKRAGA